MFFFFVEERADPLARCLSGWKLPMAGGLHFWSWQCSGAGLPRLLFLILLASSGAASSRILQGPSQGPKSQTTTVDVGLLLLVSAPLNEAEITIKIGPSL